MEQREDVLVTDDRLFKYINPLAQRPLYISSGRAKAKEQKLLPSTISTYLKGLDHLRVRQSVFFPELRSKGGKQDMSRMRLLQMIRVLKEQERERERKSFL